jgi:hypothetical protein
MTQNSAYFFFEQKVLAEDPSGADQTSYYESNFDTTALNSVKSAGLSLLSEAAWGTVTTNIQQEVSGDGDKCPTAGSSRTASSYAFNDGSTGTNAYAAGADCTWEFSPSTSNSYVNIEITKLLSEQGVFKAGGEYDALEIFDTQSGDLMATFTGRWDPTKLPEIRSSTKGDKVTVRWSTDDYDENAIGYLEEVGFSATASSTTAGVNSNCADGQSGASCEYDYCLGVVTKQASGSWESIRSQLSGLDLYAPNSRCGWRIEASPTMEYVELKFTELAIENGVDFVKIYEGSTAPTGFSLTDPATEPKLLYAATGATPPSTLTFQGSVFVTFESDGLGNTAVGAAGNGGFELEYRSISASSSLGNNCDGDWTSPIKNCALDHCTGTQERDGVHGHGSFSSSSGQSAAAATDYPAMTTCRWEFEVSPGFTGLSFKALVWDVEASGALTSTTDAVKIYNNDEDGTLVGTLKGGDDPAEWEFEYTATSGKFVAVFESDLNNPVPKKGFDLMYAGMYGTSAGMLGGFCSGDWPCVEGECDGGTCKTPSKKGSNEIPGYVIAMIVVMCVLLLGLAVFLYFYRKKMKAKSCVEIKILRRVRAESSRRPLRHRRDACVDLHAIDATPASTFTPSTRHLLDGVAMPVPRRSTEPGRQRHRRAPDTLVDFHTGVDVAQTERDFDIFAAQELHLDEEVALLFFEDLAQGYSPSPVVDAHRALPANTSYAPC